MFFVVPPYTECGATLYPGWTNTDVRASRDRLTTLRGQWMVMLNDTPSIREIFEGCSLLLIERAKGINSKAADRIYRELVITSAK